MAKSKKMNEASFAKLVKEFNSVGEFILTRQNEKQSVMNDFDAERARCKKGHVSEDTLLSSAKKVNAELVKLDKSIRDAIVKTGKISENARAFVRKQSPTVFRASLAGVHLASKKSAKKKVKKSAKKKVSRKPAKKGASASRNTLKREMALDKKFSR